MIPTLTVKPLPYTSLEGLSEEQLRQHHDVLYAGYVKKVNEIQEILSNPVPGEPNATYSTIREVKLEETFAIGGVKLHEAYFSCLGGSGQPGGTILDMITEEYGSFEKWDDYFRKEGLSARGWAVLGYDLEWNVLHNYSLDAHNFGEIFGVLPLFVLDVYEHAYFIDYGTNRKGYIDAVMKNANWDYANKVCRAYDLANRRQQMGKAA